MKKFAFLFILLVFLVVARPVFAIYDPASKPNNIFGIHILFTTELDKAAKLVNSSGGDWGYVTVPIQYGDRNLERWQDFMTNARTHHLIPIVRVATEPYFKNTGVWRKPDDFDLVDFANFLNSLTWPTKNHYVLLFNETNRFDEWGGEAPSPQDYADFIAYAADVFHSRSSDFFVIGGGLDNASPNDKTQYYDNLVYLRQMGEHNPDSFKKIDGFASHSYPNPDFSQPPSIDKQEGTSTYKYELQIIDQYAEKTMPVFITETGWNADRLPQDVIASYYKLAMTDIWGKDSRVIAVTPFILQAGGGPFDKFTFYRGDNLTSYAKAYQDLSKKKGDPSLTPQTIVKISKQPITKKSKFPIIYLPKIEFNSALLKSYIKVALGIKK